MSTFFSYWFTALVGFLVGWILKSKMDRLNNYSKYFIDDLDSDIDNDLM